MAEKKLVVVDFKEEAAKLGIRDFQLSSRDIRTMLHNDFDSNEIKVGLYGNDLILDYDKASGFDLDEQIVMYHDRVMDKLSEEEQTDIKEKYIVYLPSIKDNVIKFKEHVDEQFYMSLVPTIYIAAKSMYRDIMVEAVIDVFTVYYDNQDKEDVVEKVVECLHRQNHSGLSWGWITLMIRNVLGVDFHDKLIKIDKEILFK